ncbi:MAG: hypothetical protein HY013_20485 [Candidatus Solibacter usitatus]|nr:hypothetical protein [Candidatus Solibacter usitatus]
MTRQPIPIQVAVEDPLSDAVVRTLLGQSSSKFAIGATYMRGGFGYLRRTVAGFNQAAHGTPFLVLTDLDRAACPPALIGDWLPQPKHHNLIFRVAVRAVEAWILAHREEFARLLGIRASLIPDEPDVLENPKATLVGLAAKSRLRSVRDAIVPARGSTAAAVERFSPTW